MQQFLSSATRPLWPIHDLWVHVFLDPVDLFLHQLYSLFAGLPPLEAIGAYGMAIVTLTVVVKLVLWPLYHYQIKNSRRMMENQRRLAPLLNEVKQKYKSDPVKVQEETMKIYQEHGVNPLGGLVGCLPALVQFPIWVALYWAFYNNAKAKTYHHASFLFIPNLNDLPAHHHLGSLPIPDLPYLVFPLLAGITTFVQAKMMQPPPNPNATEQELMTQQTTQTMTTFMPVIMGVFAINAPAGLGLYWSVSNSIAIVQQYLVVGWGGLRRDDGPSPSVKPTSSGPKPSRGPGPKSPPGVKKRAKRTKR